MLSFEELVEELRPLIYKYSHNNGDSRWAKGGIPGSDADDFEQEALTIIWKCQQSYDPDVKSGFEGRKSTFMNFLIHSLDNKFGKLRMASDKYYRPITELECEECKRRVPAQGRAKCVCGSRRWKPWRGAMTENLDDVLSEPFSQELELNEVAVVLDELPASLSEIGRKVVHDLPLTNQERLALKMYGAQDCLPPELSYQKSVRVRREGVLSNGMG